MTAIDRNLLENYALLTEARRLKKAGFISPERFVEIKSNLEVPKTQESWLVRAGFFLLGILLYLSIHGVLALFVVPISLAVGIEDNIQMILLALIGLVLTEVLVRQNYYRFGLDGAFIFCSQIGVYAAVGTLTESAPGVFLAMAVFSRVGCMRYVSVFLAVISVIGISGFFASLIIEYEIIPTAFLPFVMFLIAVGLFFASRKMSEDKSLFLYADAILAVRIFAYILGYLSLNYLVVRQLSEVLMDVHVGPGQDIPLAIVFYAATVTMPILYLIYGIRKRDRALFNIGILAAAFSIFTIRFYNSILPIEIALTIGGILLFGATYFFIRKIRENDTGLTFKPDRYTDSEALALAQAAIVNSHSHIRTVTTPDSSMPYGGGGFSGGGSGESY